MVAACLRPLGEVAFEFAASGLEAIERLALASYDLVVLDLNMPDVGGIEVIEFIRSAGQAAGASDPRRDDPGRRCEQDACARGGGIGVSAQTIRARADPRRGPGPAGRQHRARDRNRRSPGVRRRVHRRVRAARRIGDRGPARDRASERRGELRAQDRARSVSRASHDEGPRRHDGRPADRRARARVRDGRARRRSRRAAGSARGRSSSASSRSVRDRRARARRRRQRPRSRRPPRRCSSELARVDATGGRGTRTGRSLASAWDASSARASARRSPPRSRGPAQGVHADVHAERARSARGHHDRNGARSTRQARRHREGRASRGAGVAGVARRPRVRPPRRSAPRSRRRSPRRSHCPIERVVAIAAAESPMPQILLPIDEVAPISTVGRSFVRVELARLDELQDQLSALVVSRFRLERQIASLAAAGVDVRALREIARRPGAPAPRPPARHPARPHGARRRGARAAVRCSCAR